MRMIVGASPAYVLNPTISLFLHGYHTSLLKNIAIPAIAFSPRIHTVFTNIQPRFYFFWWGGGVK